MLPVLFVVGFFATIIPGIICILLCSHSQTLTILSTLNLDIAFGEEQMMFENCLNEARKGTRSFQDLT